MKPNYICINIRKMEGYSKTTLLGTLGADPVTKNFNDKVVTTFSLAINSSYKDKTTNEKKTTTEWVNVECWGALATTASNWLKKGENVLVEGKLRTSVKEGENGAPKQYFTKVVVDNIVFIGSGQQQSSQPQPNITPVHQNGQYVQPQVNGGYAQPVVQNGGYVQPQVNGGYAQPAVQNGQYVQQPPVNYTQPAVQNGGYAQPQVNGGYVQPGVQNTQVNGGYVQQPPIDQSVNNYMQQGQVPQHQFEATADDLPF